MYVRIAESFVCKQIFQLPVHHIVNTNYAGRKSIDEIIELIQDKVGKYVNENR